MLPSALTASFTFTAPSVKTSRSPFVVTSVASDESVSANETNMSVTSSAKSSILNVTFPSFTLSMTSFPPAASVTFSALNFTPSFTVTDLPARATPLPTLSAVVHAVPSYSAPPKTAPFSTTISPTVVSNTGSAMVVAPPSMAEKISSLLANPAAAAENSPPTFTLAPSMKDMPAGLNIHTLPLALSVPAISEGSVPETTLKNWLPSKLRDCPLSTLSALQSIKPALPLDNPIVAEELLAPAPSTVILPVVPLITAPPSAPPCNTSPENPAEAVPLTSMPSNENIATIRRRLLLPQNPETVKFNFVKTFFFIFRSSCIYPQNCP